MNATDHKQPTESLNTDNLTMDESQTGEEIALQTATAAADTFLPPSVDEPALLSGASYTYFSPIPPSLLAGVPCVLGVDEAGRGPVLGPMVYGVFFLPLAEADTLLRRAAHRFDDSKALTPAVRSALMVELCRPGSDLHRTCGWAVSALSARSIGAGMLRPAGAQYNLNAQAMDATEALIRGVCARGVDLREIYVDTVGPPATYQRRLERVFPTAKITVAKKADSIYPCVSAASVCAKVTRDVALDVLYRGRSSYRRAGEDNGEEDGVEEEEEETQEPGWGSGYPSDVRCTTWLKRNAHPVFGWGPECRFSWGTAKDILEAKDTVQVEWPVEEDGESARLTDFFVTNGEREEDADELGSWFGTPAGLEAF